MVRSVSRRRFLTYASVGAVSAATLARPVTARRVTQLDECTTITESGRYELASDITHTSSGICLAIRARNVTLDGGGYTLSSTSDVDTVGVLVGSVRNVTVENLTVEGFENGFSAVGPRTRFENVVARNNRIAGVIVEPDADRTTIANSELSHNGSSGIAAVIASGLRISDNTISSNGGVGIVFRQGISRSTIQRNVVTDNGPTRLGSGIAIWEGGDQNKILDNVTSGNAKHGISLNDFNPEPASKLFVEGNTALGNGQDGVFLRLVDNSAVSNNVLRQNGDDGIELDASDRNRLTRNVVCDNGDEPIALSPDSADNRLRANVTEC